MRVVTSACHEEIETHLHVQNCGWVRLADRRKRICVVRVDVHDPKSGLFEGISVAVDEPDEEKSV